MGKLGWVAGCASGANKKRQQAQAMGAQDPWVLAGASAYGCLFAPDKKASKAVDDAVRTVQRWWRKAGRFFGGGKRKKNRGRFGYDDAIALVIASLQRTDYRDVPEGVFAVKEGRRWRQMDVGRVLYLELRVRLYGDLQPVKGWRPKELYAVYAALWKQAREIGFVDPARIWTLVFWAVGRNSGARTPGDPLEWPLLPPATAVSAEERAAFEARFVPSRKQRVWETTKSLAKRSWPLVLAGLLGS